MLQINDLSYDIAPGSLVYFLSGTPYRFRASGGKVPRMIVINFDFTDSFAHLSQPFPLRRAEGFSDSDRLENITLSDAPELNQPAILSSFPEILPLLRQMTEEFRSPDNFSDMMLSHLLSLILNSLRRRTIVLSGRKKSGNCQRILEYIQQHYAEDLTNLRLAAVFGYHPNYIGNLVAANTGLPLHRYLLQLRVRQALFLLQSTDLPISEIAVKTGFRDVSYFSQYFKKCTGFTPGTFRKNI